MAKKNSGGASTSTPTEKVKKAKRAAYPGIGAAKGYPFTTVPADYDFTKHKPLGKKNFDEKSTGHAEFRASALEFKAKRMTDLANKIRKEIEVEKTFGTPEQRKRAKKALSLAEQLKALNEELAKDGISQEKLDSLKAATTKTA